MQRDVAVAAETVDPPQDGVVGAGAPPHGVDHRKPDRDDESLEHAEDDDACGRDRGDRDLDAVDRRQRAPRPQLA